MKLRKFSIDDVEIIEQEPHQRTILGESGKSHRIFLPYSVYFFRKSMCLGRQIKTLHFGFCLNKWAEDVPLLLPPINTIFDEHLLCCVRPTLEDWWSVPTSFSWYYASGKVMEKTFLNFHNWSSLSKNQCWDMFHNWPSTLKTERPEGFSKNTTIKTIVDYNDVIKKISLERLSYLSRYSQGLA